MWESLAAVVMVVWSARPAGGGNIFGMCGK